MDWQALVTVGAIASSAAFLGWRGYGRVVRKRAAGCSRCGEGGVASPRGQRKQIVSLDELKNRAPHKPHS